MRRLKRVMFPEDVLRAVFLKWELLARENPHKYMPPAGSEANPDLVADRCTEHFLRIAEDMGVLHD